MLVLAHGFSVPKAGNSEAENDDGHYPQGPLESRADVFRCAVADGATESSFSGPLARSLANFYRLGRLTPKLWDHSISTLRARWTRQISAKPLPWYAQEKVEHGAFAALVGLTIRGVPVHGNDGTWNATAVGDCCLAHVRGDRILHQFPLDHAVEFNSRPYLIASRADRNVDLATHIRTASGKWHVDDTFFLMSDALACWFSQEREKGLQPWTVLRDIDTEGDQTDFNHLIESLRSAGKIKNDDVTLVRIDVGAR